MDTSHSFIHILHGFFINARAYINCPNAGEVTLKNMNKKDQHQTIINPRRIVYISPESIPVTLKN